MLGFGDGERHGGETGGGETGGGAGGREIGGREVDVGKVREPRLLRAVVERLVH
jgi:hypothetical protein